MELTFGIKDGKAVHVSQVERGLSCVCICPACNHQLVAKKGNVKQHHFAHHKDSECNLETAIHFMAKKIIKDSGEIYVPDTELPIAMTNTTVKLCTGKIVSLDDIEDEKYMGNITPDIIGYYNKTPLLIEIYVTHKTDDMKIDKIKSMSRSAIEIDLSSISYDTSIEELTQLVLYNKDNRHWLNNNRANIKQLQLTASAVLRDTIYYKQDGTYITDCPIRSEIRPNLIHVHIDVCKHCEYCYGIQTFPENVLCGLKNNPV